MKLIIVVVRREDTNRVRETLLEAGIGHTRIATTGGFRGTGNTTFLIGTENGQVDEVLNTIKMCLRQSMVKSRSSAVRENDSESKAVVFVTDVYDYKKV